MRGCLSLPGTSSVSSPYCPAQETGVSCVAVSHSPGPLLSPHLIVLPRRRVLRGCLSLSKTSSGSSPYCPAQETGVAWLSLTLQDLFCLLTLLSCPGDGWSVADSHSPGPLLSPHLIVLPRIRVLVAWLSLTLQDLFCLLTLFPSRLSPSFSHP